MCTSVLLNTDCKRGEKKSLGAFKRRQFWVFSQSFYDLVQNTLFVPSQLVQYFPGRAQKYSTTTLLSTGDFFCAVPYSLFNIFTRHTILYFTITGAGLIFFDTKYTVACQYLVISTKYTVDDHYLVISSKYTVVGVSGKLIEDTLTCSEAGYKTMIRVTKH